MNGFPFCNYCVLIVVIQFMWWLEKKYVTVNSHMLREIFACFFLADMLGPCNIGKGKLHRGWNWGLTSHLTQS